MELLTDEGKIIKSKFFKIYCRDKELEINQIEQERHCMREKRDGKHYLIESYLKGLPDISKNGK